MNLYKKTIHNIHDNFKLHVHVKRACEKEGKMSVGGATTTLDDQEEVDTKDSVNTKKCEVDL